MPELRRERFAVAGGREAAVSVWRGDDRGDGLLGELPAAWRDGLPAHPTRRAETLAARRALLALRPDAAGERLRKDGYGKPHLPDGDHLSLTHSHGHAAALVAPHACGVDLQLRVAKIARLRSKFERPDERAFVAAASDEVGALHVLWGAKESLYKLWGRRAVDWHADLVVAPFAYRARGGGFAAEVRKGGRVISAAMRYWWVGEFCLVTAVQSADQPGPAGARFGDSPIAE